MNKGLEALEKIKNAPTIYVGCASDIYTRYSFECKEIEKALKALEIIIERVVDIGYIIDCETEPEYLNRMCHRVYAEQNDFRQPPAYKRMTQEEFNLLKEVLKRNEEET